MKIALAKNSGFCPGVKRAVKIAKAAVKKCGQPVFMFGPLVHNEEVAKFFKNQGAKEIDSIDKVPFGAYLVVSAHGIGPISRKKISDKKIKIIDTTCSWVKRTHKIVKDFLFDGYEIILLGEKRHREVEGIKEWGREVKVVSGEKEARAAIEKIKNKKAIFVSQTTQGKNLFDRITKLIKEMAPDTIIFDTICKVTLARQREVSGLARKSDVIIIVGSKNSANSKRLYDISKDINKKTYFVSKLNNIKRSWFYGAKKVVVASGASAPPEFIGEIKRRISFYDKAKENKSYKNR